MKKLILLIACFVAAMASAQDYHKATFNAGGGVGIPVGQTSDFVGTSGNVVVGGGYNLKRHVAITGEFMWDGLPPSTKELSTLTAPRNAGASGNLYSLTANLLGRLPTHGKLGAYVIGGGGWYHRNWNIHVPSVAPGTVCGPSWNWFGVRCVSGLVPVNAVVASGSSDGGGLNIGAGLTFGHENGPKFYAEARYHYAWHNLVNTSVLPVTFGIRW